jgi:hypothetical protein
MAFAASRGYRSDLGLCPTANLPLKELMAHPVVVYRDRAAGHSAEAVKAATDVSSRGWRSIPPRSASK